MNTIPVKVADTQQSPQVFAHNQQKYGYTVLIIRSTAHNDWNNAITMKDLYDKGFYQ
ncbi:MAG TPA: hypothetical protein VIM41_06010 [Gammaproteobacteria bacterium]